MTAVCSGGSPAALARQLVDAPQAVPFDERVQLLRALIVADRER